MTFISKKMVMVPAALALGLGVLAACGDGGSETGGPSESSALTFDNCGREISLDAAPESVLVIGGEAATVVTAAGGADLVDTFIPLIDEPLGDAEEALADAEQIPVQTASEMSREVIVGADPDLVVTFGLSNVTPEDLRESGIETYVLAGYCGGFGAGQSEVEDPLQGVLDDVTTLGEVFGTEDVAEAEVADFEQRIDAVATEFEDAPEESAMAVFAVDPDTALGAYGSRSMIHQQMDMIGLRNVFVDTDERYFDVGLESIVDSGAERVIALYEPGDTSESDAAAAVTERSQLADLPAVQDDNVTALDFFYSGHGTLAIDGLENLAELVTADR